MSLSRILTSILATGLLCLAMAAPSAELQAKIDKKKAEFSTLSNDAKVVAAVKAYNSAPPAMTNEKWKTLSVISPEVKGLAKNELATYLKGKKTPEISEMFVSGIDGGKVAFLSKPTSWTHKGKAKHDNPMANKAWTGDVEMDESSGKQSVQFAIPVLDGGKPIGSIVIGLSIADLK